MAATQSSADLSHGSLEPTHQQIYDDKLEGEQIRILSIEPGGGPLACTLLQLTLGDDTKYDALSYCWGESSAKRSLRINGQHDFQISQHVYDALIRLRRKDKQRKIWIDQICINQIDKDEKSGQVALMGDIYRCAHRVVIWIGESNAEEATCPRIFQDVEASGVEQAFCTKEGSAALVHKDLSSVLTRFLRQSKFGIKEAWWSRVWTIQEFGLAKHVPVVYIGPHAVSWAFFSKALGEQRCRVFSGLVAGATQSLYSLLLRASDNDCWNPRDRIYALRALATEKNLISPNYNRSIISIYAETAHLLITREGKLDVLLDHRVDRTKNSIPNWKDDQLPTWIPDFASLVDPKTIETLEDFEAAAKRLPVCSVLISPSNGHTLKIRGVVFDSISQRTTLNSLRDPDYVRSRPDMSGLFSRLYGTCRDIIEALELDYRAEPHLHLDRSPNIGYLTLEYIFKGQRSVLEEIRRCSRLDSPYGGTRGGRRDRKALSKIEKYLGAPLSDADIRDLRAAQLWENVFLRVRHGGHFEIRQGNLWEFEQVGRPMPEYGSIRHYAIPKSRASGERYQDFFATKNNFTGLGPKSLQVNDLVVVAFGAKRPLILRKSEQGNAYQLVGSAIVPSIMSGQLVGLYNAGEVKARDFELI